MNINNLEKIYFIGIGGIGMSALARYFNDQGVRICGYDKTKTSLTKKLVSEGMEIHYHDDPALVTKDIDLVVYTPAIPKENKELSYAKKSSIPVLKRSEVLGLISKQKKCIAVAGTHGKTTTSSMISHILKHCDIDISCFLGGIANNFNSNYCYGESEWVVVEADEYDRSFHRLKPEIAIISSMDPDHLDIYGDEDSMKKAYQIFLEAVNEGGTIIMENGLLENFDASFFEYLHRNEISLLTYGESEGDFQVQNIEYNDALQTAEWCFENEILRIEMSMPGVHNAKNMCAAISTAHLMGIEKAQIAESVKAFTGIKRRFQRVYEDEQCTYIDDYAHHPGEIQVAIDSARKLWPEHKLTVVFQPHLFSRTQDFLEGFAKELSRADEIILMEIYPAREKPIEGVDSSLLLERIELQRKMLLADNEVVKELSRRKIDLLMTLGAGDIDLLVPEIKEMLEKNAEQA